MREILNDLLEHGVSTTIFKTAHQFNGQYADCYKCVMEKDHNGTSVKVEHYAVDSEEAVQGAYNKFCSLVGHGKPELYKPLLSAPTLTYTDAEQPDLDYDNHYLKED